jgi:hypothetical protein
MIVFASMTLLICPVILSVGCNEIPGGGFGNGVGFA